MKKIIATMCGLLTMLALSLAASAQSRTVTIMLQDSSSGEPVLWDKERIMEVYLNVAEMGKGVYGVEAAAETHFGTSATKLTRRQACLIAACLPNPIKRDAGKPSSYISKRAGDIAALEPKIAYPDWVSHKK